MSSENEVEVICPYCNDQAELVDDSEVYDRSYGGKIWICRPCGAYVGTHKNSRDHKPLGRLADKELRTWRIKVHGLFDPLWMKKMAMTGCTSGEARDAGYGWLALQMGKDPGKCHIAWFDVDECLKAIGILRRVTK